jgi:hypothetical protein
MVASKTGFVGHLKQLIIICVFLHCFIRQDALYGKIIKTHQTVKMVVNTVNIISGGKSSKTQSIHYIFGSGC